MKQQISSTELKMLDIAIEEYKLVQAEISEYSKRMLETIGLFFTVSPIVISFSMEKIHWVFYLFQALTLFFLVFELSLDRDIYIDSAYSITIENEINIMFGRKVLAWQNKVAYFQSRKDGAKRPSSMGPLVLFMVFGLFYGFTVYNGLQLIGPRTLGLVYLIFSATIFIGISILAHNSRNRQISEVLRSDLDRGGSRNPSLPDAAPADREHLPSHP